MRKIVSKLFYGTLRAMIFPAALIYLCFAGNAHSKYWECSRCGKRFSGTQQEDIERHVGACWLTEVE